ncbi:hypothetical protein NDU88_000072 [Pleurodeles waltl]|uniref:Uncharacterized protein n=1 Tax=Pleurodeles waltl TaxID=8319 RepID=A0AAV7U2L2_PLEWA|nr:hypothetical protein NDU88_000072 [Pleurodeles waltl]
MKGCVISEKSIVKHQVLDDEVGQVLREKGIVEYQVLDDDEHGLRYKKEGYSRVPSAGCRSRVIRLGWDWVIREKRIAEYQAQDEEEVLSYKREGYSREAGAG